jgi:PAS domain-containing protein
MATRRSGGRPAEGTRLPKIGPAEAGLLTTIRHTAAILAGALSLAVLYGWAFDRDELIRPAMGFSATNPMSAVGFFLTACALTLDPRRHIVVVRILAGLVITIALARFAELIGDLPHGVSQWLFAEKLSRARAGNSFGVTAASLFLLGVATLVSASGRRNLVLVTQIGCIGVILVALFVAVGYALEHLGLGGALLVTIPLYSAPVLLALATAALCLNADTGVMRAILNRGSTGTLVRSALPFILFALVLIGTEDGSLPLLLINLAATVSLIGGGIVALYRGDRLRRDRELAMEQSEGRYRHAEQVGHVGHWRMDSASGAFRWSDEVYEILGLPRSAGRRRGPPHQVAWGLREGRGG